MRLRPGGTGSSGAVGTTIAGRPPPHGSVRARSRIRLILDVWRRSALEDKGAELAGKESSVPAADITAAKASDRAGCAYSERLATISTVDAPVDCRHGKAHLQGVRPTDRDLEAASVRQIGDAKWRYLRSDCAR
jgi:hypothetical protein